MSRVYWHAKERTAELLGSERAWLQHVADGPARAAWDLERVGSQQLERASLLMSLVVDPPDHLTKALTAARAADDRLRAAVGADIHGAYDPEPLRTLVRDLTLHLRVTGLDLDVAGVRLNTSNVDLNTALVAGSDPMRVAAKVSAWCESHAWVEGTDRKWLAGIVDDGLRGGLFRRGIWYVNRPCEGPAENQPDRRWSDQGWGDVLDLLRESDDGPVVLSYSVGGRFPNAEVAGWEPPPMPDGWEPDWADTAKGHAEWDRDYPTGDDKAAYYYDEAGSQWYDLPADEQWDTAVAGLRSARPWAQLSPDALAGYAFHLPVSVFDLFAPDREERVRAAARLADEDTASGED
jgi:hypothetical protein